MRAPLLLRTRLDARPGPLTAATPPCLSTLFAGATCSECELGENLWLCLTCGSLGCGRPQFGGGGGHGHGLAHYDQTGHPVALKLGTITPEGSADIYCYACDDAKTDPELNAHCATFGIHLASQTKTEKSMTELVRPCAFAPLPRRVRLG